MVSPKSRWRPRAGTGGPGATVPAGNGGGTGPPRAYLGGGGGGGGGDGPGTCARDGSPAAKGKGWCLGNAFFPSPLNNARCHWARSAGSGQPNGEPRALPPPPPHRQWPMRRVGMSGASREGLVGGSASATNFLSSVCFFSPARLWHPRGPGDASRPALPCPRLRGRGLPGSAGPSAEEKLSAGGSGPPALLFQGGRELVVLL